jgi:hypothetical protein
MKKEKETRLAAKFDGEVRVAVPVAKERVVGAVPPKVIHELCARCREKIRSASVDNPPSQ